DLTPAQGGNAAGSPVTTRNAYDANSHLSYTVSAQGDVSQYLYDALGRQISAIQYTGAVYNLTGLGSGIAISKSTLDGWVAALADKTAAKRTDTAYDFRGNVSTVKTYSALNSDGSGNTSNPTVYPFLTTTYVY